MAHKVNYPNHASGCFNKITAAYNEVVDFHNVQQDPDINKMLDKCENLLRQARQIITDIQNINGLPFNKN